MPRYDYDVDRAEREPLDGRQYHQQQRAVMASQSPSHQFASPDYPQQTYPQDQPYSPYRDQPPQQYQDRPPQPPPVERTGPRLHPGAHPDSAFARSKDERRRSREQGFMAGPGGYAAGNQASFTPGPTPPPHRGPEGQQHRGQPPPEDGYAAIHNTITPGADNFSESAGGGVAGIAYSVAERHTRESEVDSRQPSQQPQSQGQPAGRKPVAYNAAMGAAPRQQGSPTRDQRMAAPQQYSQQPNLPPQSHQPHQHANSPYDPPHGGAQQSPYASSLSSHDSHGPRGRGVAAGAAGAAAGGLAAGAAYGAIRNQSRSPHNTAPEVYTDNPYQGWGPSGDPRLGVVNPHEIEDDGDDGLEYRRQGRTSMLSLSGLSDRARGDRDNNSTHSGAIGGGLAGAAIGAGAAGAALSGRGASGYNPVHNGTPGANSMTSAYAGGAGGMHEVGSDYNLADRGGKQSEWLEKQNSGKKRWRWCLIAAVVLVIIAGIVVGVLFGVVFKNGGPGKSGSSGGGGGGSAFGGGGGLDPNQDTQQNGDLDINSAEIKAILSQKELKKVFPGIDYTPLNTQYPECLHWPPSQNNVTRDVAALSLMTNTIRLYGTDCNQTQMVIHAINQLQLQDTVKVWMGVWQDGNTTTNARQLAQMWDILDNFGAKPFKGIIVANEILFRKQMTAWELGNLMSQVRTNLTTKGMKLPVATSDLGDALTADLALQSDYVMANIHPFFAGVTAEEASDWTTQFWTGNNGPIWKSDKSKNVISETGWPSQGGTNCGQALSCAKGSKAGIDELNRFMEDWVCKSLNDGTQYFWFEAFDEPWKVRFNEKGKEWEDHWGLMDVNRRLKDGIVIPDCGGKRIP